MLGIMAKTPHLFFFFFFLSCLALLFRSALQPPFGSLCMDSMGVFMRLHAESWSRSLTAEACYHSAHPPPPWYFCPSPPPKPPISVLACLLLQHLVHNHPTSHFFFLPALGGTQDKGEKVAQFPPQGALTFPERNTPGHPNTLLNTCAVSHFIVGFAYEPE